MPVTYCSLCVGSILVPCLFITHIISSVLRSIICVVVDSGGFSIPSSQAVVVEILFSSHGGLVILSCSRFVEEGLYG